ncbi:GDSL-type esterase/lipase family protein [Specibacter cremeus]|uniref:GDSL-type esterase/lipase family protein n=1 Tax=Specibacter cremeus TaxID=1629051 RepID=UPI00197B1605|nr:GDSL-type esterase/lipase family protein [Specibacter cremeus]
MEHRKLRIAAVGDELVAGVGDPRALGWLGRVLARTPQDDVSVESFVLASPQEGTEALAARWLQEAGRRFDDFHENRLVVGLSGRDIEFGLTTARSRLNLANILDGASQLNIPVFVVGPPPSLDPALNRKLADLNAAFADVTTRRKHSYVDTFAPLQNHEQWRTDLAANAGSPGQAGYGLMAWLVLHRGWHQWLNIPEAN